MLDDILQKEPPKKTRQITMFNFILFFAEKRGLRRAIIYTKSLVFKIPKLL